MDIEDIKNDKASENINELAKAIYKNFEQLNQSQYEDIIDYTHTKKLTNSPHEIIFEITANVMEENNKGEIIGTKEICTKKYHIPVPIDKDYDIYMKTFFQHIEDCLLSAAKTSQDS
jgi:hypothetical protein